MTVGQRIKRLEGFCADFDVELYVAPGSVAARFPLRWERFLNWGASIGLPASELRCLRNGANLRGRGPLPSPFASAQSPGDVGVGTIFKNACAL